MLLRVIEHGAAEAQNPSDGIGGGHLPRVQVLREGFPQRREPALKQVLLVEEVGIEGRAPDIGPVDEILDGDGVVVLLGEEGHERIAQARAGPADPAIANSR
ncbi:hypothetical protein D3C72_2158330 [compost metagenome]